MLKYFGFNDDICLRLQLENCYGVSPYMRCREFNNYVDAYGVPICIKGSQLFPDFPLKYNVERTIEKPYTYIVSMTTFVLHALGVLQLKAIPIIAVDLISDKLEDIKADNQL